MSIAYVLVVWDLLDHRMRILDLRSYFDGVQGVLIQHVLKVVAAEIMDTPLTVVVDIRADNIRHCSYSAKSSLHFSAYLICFVGVALATTVHATIAAKAAPT